MRTSMSMGSGVVTMAQATQLLFDPNTDSLKELQFLPFLQLPWSDHKTRLHHTSHSDTIIAFIKLKNLNAPQIENKSSSSSFLVERNSISHNGDSESHQSPPSPMLTCLLIIKWILDSDWSMKRYLTLIGQWRDAGPGSLAISPRVPLADVAR